MFWAFLIVMLLITRLDDIIELFKSRNPVYQEEKTLKAMEEEKNKQELLSQFQQALNQHCIISFKSFIYSSKYSNKLSGLIIAVDDQWIEIELEKKNKRKRIILDVNEISTIANVV